jgi:hypothetical protein
MIFDPFDCVRSDRARVDVTSDALGRGGPQVHDIAITVNLIARSPTIGRRESALPMLSTFWSKTPVAANGSTITRRRRPIDPRMVGDAGIEPATPPV